MVVDLIRKRNIIKVFNGRVIGPIPVYLGLGYGTKIYGRLVLYRHFCIAAQGIAIYNIEIRNGLIPVYHQLLCKCRNTSIAGGNSQHHIVITSGGILMFGIFKSGCIRVTTIRIWISKIPRINKATGGTI